MERIDLLLTKFNVLLDVWAKAIDSLSDNTWYSIGFAVGASVIGFVLLNMYKNSYYRRKAENLAKSAVALLLTVQAAIIALAGAAIGFAEYANLIPYGVQILGIFYLIYNFGGNKLYIKVTDALRKWSTKREYKKAHKDDPKPSIFDNPTYESPNPTVLTTTLPPRPVTTDGTQYPPKPSSDLLI